MIDGESVSPPCATMTLRPSAAAFARSAFTTAARRANPPRLLPSGNGCSPIREKSLNNTNVTVVLCAGCAQEGRHAPINASVEAREERNERRLSMALSYPQRINMQYAPSDVADSNSMNELARFGARPADHPAVASGRIGVLLVNLGTPDATDYWSMR